MCCPYLQIVSIVREQDYFLQSESAAQEGVLQSPHITVFPFL